MFFEKLFSRRYKKENGLFPDIYQYEKLPDKLKITLLHIFEEAFHYETFRFNKIEIENVFQKIYKTICKEHSLLNFYNHRDTFKQTMIDFFYKEKNLIISLDVIELFCILINFVKNKYYTNEDTKKQFNMFIEEINQKMLEHGFGYQFENELLIRIDTKFTHCKIVKPALKFLIDKKFKNANDEYIKAHEAYKNNDYETVFVECNKAFESTMKIICNLNKFDYKQNDVSSRLISILREKGFIKNYNDEILNGLVKVFLTPSNLRNNEGAHGKGTLPDIVDKSFVDYALHSTASNILFLVQRQLEYEKNKK